MLQGFECYRISNVTGFRMLQDFECYMISNVTRFRMLQDFECYRISNVTGFRVIAIYASTFIPTGFTNRTNYNTRRKKTYSRSKTIPSDVQ